MSVVLGLLLAVLVMGCGIYESYGFDYKKVDEFNKNKSKLIDLLNGFNAVELADEVRISLNVPENVAKTRMSFNESDICLRVFS